MNHTDEEPAALDCVGLPAGYEAPSGGFDEMITSNRELRAPWRRFLEGLNRRGLYQLGSRADHARRLLRENGVTYNPLLEQQGAASNWELDPLPLLFEQTEWEGLSSAVRQRAELLDAIIADVYGERRLLREKILPPDLLFQHPGYLIPCHGLQPAKGRFLHFYACQLVRGADGTWSAIADRSQGPSGAGYAVENRVVISRTLPHDFESLHIERLAPFFAGLREHLLSITPRHHENPRIVLLSPGARSPSYFEDGYLARYLGYTLVEGGDLTVRGDTVYLKTLGGLVPVDVVLRRVFDTDCDPLELRPDSLYGISGLTQACRAGGITLANSLGAGFVEAPALAAFLPQICRFLLSEELKLPSLPTYWCGNEADHRYVEAHLEDLLVRNSFTHRGQTTFVGASLTLDQRRQLLERIARRPESFVAHPRVTRSTAPIWNHGRLEPRHVGLRLFAAAVPSAYNVMPGGLARLSKTPFAVDESSTGRERSKDVWVLSDGPVEPVSLLKNATSTLELRRSTADLPSRVADHLYWLGRLMERCDAIARRLRSCVARLSMEIEPADLDDISLLVSAATGDKEPLDPDEGLTESEAIDRLYNTIIAWIFEEHRPDSLAATLMSLHRTAAAVRDRISVDSWRIVNQLRLDVLFPWDARNSRLGDLLLLLTQVLNLLAALGGLGTESMTRGPGWRFLDMGRRIERALTTLEIVGRMFVPPHPDLVALLEGVLEICDGSITYRNRYLSKLHLGAVLDLVLIDETNPRAVGFQLNALSKHVADLPQSTNDRAARPREEQLMLSSQAMLRLTDVDALSVADEEGTRSALRTFLGALERNLSELSIQITHRYLTHTAPSRHLAGDEASWEMEER